MYVSKISGCSACAVYHFGRIRNWNLIVRNIRISSQREPDIQYSRWKQTWISNKQSRCKHAWGPSPITPVRPTMNIRFNEHLHLSLFFSSGISRISTSKGVNFSSVFWRHFLWSSLSRTFIFVWSFLTPTYQACHYRVGLFHHMMVPFTPMRHPLFPPFPLSIYFVIFCFLLFPFFNWLYLFSSFVHPFPFYQNSPTPFPGRRS